MELGLLLSCLTNKFAAKICEQQRNNKYNPDRIFNDCAEVLSVVHFPLFANLHGISQAKIISNRFVHRIARGGNADRTHQLD